MNDHEINAAIAEACPKLFSKSDTLGWCYFHNGELHGCIEGSICADLNAMHEAEERGIYSLPETIAGDATRKRYRIELEKSSCKTWGDRIFRASARQRAEAFLRATGKWKRG